jgi:hypothetical protein
VISISGGGFAATTAGWVWYDSDADNTRDAAEAQVTVTTDANGSIPAGVTLTVPAGAPSANVIAEITAGQRATAAFTVIGTAIAVTPTNGAAGTVITITGSGFLSSTAGYIWFDSNSNGVRDAGEPQVAVTSTAAGAIPAGTTLTVPSVAAAVYTVYADIPTGGAIEASANFTVTVPPPPPPVAPALYSASGTVTLAAGASQSIIAIGAKPFMGTICIQSNATGYDVDVSTGTAWITVVEVGAVNASYPVSGFGLRIVNDTTAAKTITYVVVYLQ